MNGYVFALSSIAIICITILGGYMIYKTNKSYDEFIKRIDKED